MKRLVPAAFFLLTSLISFSQNSILKYLVGSTGVAGATGSNIYEDANGQIGIGNTGPTGALNVTGVVGVTGVTGVVLQIDYPSAAATLPNYIEARKRGASNTDFLINGSGNVQIGGSSHSPANLTIGNHGWPSSALSFDHPVFSAHDDNGNQIFFSANVGTSSVPSGTFVVTSSSVLPFPGSFNAAFVVGDENSPLYALSEDPAPTFYVDGQGFVGIGAGANDALMTAQLDIVQNNSVMDYLMHIGKYTNTAETSIMDLFSIDNNGYVGIGPLNTSGSNLLQVSDANGFSVTNVIEADYTYTGSTQPTSPNYFEGNSTTGETTTTNFSVNGAGQVGIRSAASAAFDFLIYSKTFGSYNSGVISQDGGLLYFMADIGSIGEPCGWMQVGSNHVGPSGLFGDVPAFTVNDQSDPTGNPIFQVSGKGTVALNTFTPVAQLDVMQGSYTGLDYLLHVGTSTTGADYLNVNNDGYIGIGKFNAGTSLVEESDVAGLGSAMPLFLIDNGNYPTDEPYFEVDGSTTGVNTGIGIKPEYHTLAMRGTSNTSLALYRGAATGTDGDEDIVFLDHGGAARHVIYDDYTSNMLTISPGLFGNASTTVNLNGQLLIGAATSLYTPSTTTDVSGTYDLIVEKGILTEMVKVAVKTTADWSDYVFDNNYHLPNFSALEAYINSNKHLPDVPSAEEVVCDGGIDVAKMDAKLLQKIEELNLYVIQLEKENKKQDAQIEDILKRVKIN